VKSKQVNPQGKGLSPAASLLAALPVERIRAKSVSQIADELFTSMFVLNSDFSFKPVIGSSYWLYQKQGIFRLSLIAPYEWSEQVYGFCIGRCQLHEDVSWTIELTQQAAADDEFNHYLEVRRRQFEQDLLKAEKLEEALPGYLEKLPYYQRVLTSVLTYSLKTSMNKSGIAALTYQQACLEHQDNSQ
jgi:hypothetical protein